MATYTERKRERLRQREKEKERDRYRCSNFRRLITILVSPSMHMYEFYLLLRAEKSKFETLAEQ